MKTNDILSLKTNATNKNKPNIANKNNEIYSPDSFTVYRLPSPKKSRQVVKEVAKDFEAFFIREFLKDSLQISGELSEKYGYFYKEIIIDVLSRSSSFGIKDFFEKAIENQLEAMQRGYITKKNFGKY
ncbi:MAG: hypothetical protein NZ927_02995 [Candidatus Calescibacterium sp.]|nr:hypothetical protein [Candidatus Calescibacterium sp.]MCX7733968.1 hypothetical protein [bacterium]MDW8086433.1 hypothetical protein [Candidatus Calescibacterium sp.]